MSHQKIFKHIPTIAALFEGGFFLTLKKTKKGGVSSLYRMK